MAAGITDFRAHAVQLGISPDLTQAAYRVGDSVSNILTPLLPYFPLVVVFCQRYVKSTGIGTVISMMVPYTIIFLIAWTIFLIIYWALGIPLSLEAHYVYPANSRLALFKISGDAGCHPLSHIK